MPRYLVCYDMPSSKRRKKISDLLLGYGSRANFSVFEIDLSASKFNKLKKELKDIVNKKEDSLRIYAVCDKCLYKSEVLCDETKPFIPVDCVVF